MYIWIVNAGCDLFRSEWRPSVTVALRFKNSPRIELHITLTGRVSGEAELREVVHPRRDPRPRSHPVVHPRYCLSEG